MALQFIKSETLDTTKYTQVLYRLNELLVESKQNIEDTDTEWMETSQRKARIQGDKLESELKVYRNNSIKESIRVRKLIAFD
jgi:COP9 signalosome complex subunit 1